MSGNRYRSPDSGLDPRQFHALNVRFYEGFHEELITARLGLLCWQHESPEAAENKLVSGTAWGRLKLKVSPEDRYAEILKRNAELELLALRQHAAEVLFRMFWVHAHRETCTWLGLARLRRPDDLKRAATDYLEGKLWTDDIDRRRYHARTMWGDSAVLEDGTLRESRLEPSADTVALWIAAAAEAVREAPLYNAYKHGLAVVPSDAFTMTLEATTESPEPLLMEAAAGFSYIERISDEPNRRHRWQHVREPVDFEVAAAETAVYANLLAPILTAGALDRGVTEPPQATNVPNAAVTPEVVRHRKGQVGFFILRFPEPLMYIE